MQSDLAESPIAGAWTSWGPVVLAALATVPIAAAVAVWLTRRRRRAGWGHDWAARSAGAEVFMIVGTLPWLFLTLTPSNEPRGANLVPLHDLAEQVQTGYTYAAIQIGGNLCVFAALGFGMPIRWRVGPLAALVVGAYGSAMIESLQWILNLGRYSSVDDVLVNALGAALGATLAWPWWRHRFDSSRHGGCQPTDVASRPGPDVAVSVRSLP